jgi:hypothetical protein
MGIVLAMDRPRAGAAGVQRPSPELPAGLILVPETCLTD